MTVVEESGKKINKPTINDKPVEKLKFFCSTTKAIPCRYCFKLIRTSQSLGIVEVSPLDFDKIIACPHVCRC
jgi:hypothetical protein